MNKKIFVIAHRGFSGEYFPNSRKALQEAVKLKVDMVEIDIRKSKDHNFVVFHDENLYRATNSKGLIKEKTLHELKKVSLKDGSKILSLKEALGILKNSEINLRLKDYLRKEDFILLLKEIKGYEHKILISSFSYPDLHALRNLNKKIKIGINCILPIKKNISKAAKIKAYSIHPHLSFFIHSFSKLAHQSNIKVFAFTPFSLHSMKLLIDADVDGIITEFPDRLQEVIKNNDSY